MHLLQYSYTEGTRTPIRALTKLDIDKIYNSELTNYSWIGGGVSVWQREKTNKIQYNCDVQLAPLKFSNINDALYNKSLTDAIKPSHTLTKLDMDKLYDSKLNS